MPEASLVQVVVVDIVDETPSIVVISLERGGGVPMPAFDAGSHLELAIPNGVKRHYSLCSDPGDLSQYKIAVLREARSRGGSEYLHASLDIDDVMLASPPRSSFALDGRASHHVFIAGGIGITPFLPMMHALSASGGSFELHYSVRRREDLAFSGDIERLARGRWHPHVSSEGDRLDPLTLLKTIPQASLVYCCGPAGLMEDVRLQALALGRAAPRCETFAAPEAGPVKAGSPFELEIGSTGAVIAVAAEETMLEGLRRSGHDIASSCEHGICGTCLVRYREGEPVHRDGVLNHAQRSEFVAACISRAKGRLVLEL